jgi:cell division protein FtsA
MVMRNQAEILKLRFGSAIADASMDNQIVSIPGLRGRDAKEISVRNLSNIINARMEEILEHVDSEINISGYKSKLIAGVVITGGGAQLKNLVQLVEYITGLDARIGLPIEHLAPVKLDTVKHPMYSTGVGLILKGYEDYDYKHERQVMEVSQPTGEETIEEKKDRKKFFGSFFENAKNFFTEGVDEQL